MPTPAETHGTRDTGGPWWWVWVAWRRVARWRFVPAAAVLALLPLAVTGVGALVRAFGQPDVATAPALAVLLVLAFFLPWRAGQVFRLARGRPPVRLPVPWLTRRAPRRQLREGQAWHAPPPLWRLADPLLGGVAAVPALLILALVPSPPGVLIGGLVALPIVLTGIWEALAITIRALAVTD